MARKRRRTAEVVDVAEQRLAAGDGYVWVTDELDDGTITVTRAEKVGAATQPFIPVGAGETYRLANSDGETWEIVFQQCGRPLTPVQAGDAPPAPTINLFEENQAETPAAEEIVAPMTEEAWLPREEGV